ncbi:MAG: FecR family protein, partial [Planctomycetales bacterium]
MNLNQELLDRILEGDLSEEERDQAAAWLESDDAVHQLAERAELHADLRRSLRRRNLQESALTDAADAVSPTSSETPTEPSIAKPEPSGDVQPIGRSQSRWSKKASAVLAVALAAAACLAIILFNVAPPSNGSQPSIASIAHQANARWADHARSQGDSVGTGVMRLDVGIVRLDFANGAAVTLQGPAVFEILQDNQTRLHRGILTAHIPESAIGFEVETPGMDVVDLGTAFGVSVGADGGTDVCVFEGEIEVSIPGSDKSRAPQRIIEGNAARTRPDGNGIEPAAYQTERFEDAWPVTSGVLQTTGLMKFVSPGPDFVPGRYENSEYILVFPERDDVVLETAAPVDLIEPGEYQRV